MDVQALIHIKSYGKGYLIMNDELNNQAEDKNTEVQGNQVEGAKKDTSTEEKQAENQNKNNEDKSGKKYTDEDVDRIVLEQKAKWKKYQEQKDDEAKKLAKMNADEKEKYNLEKVKQERDEANAKLAKFEMGKTARSMFDEANIAVSDDTLDLVVTTEADSTKENVSKILAFAETIKADVTKELSSGITPRTNGSATTTVITSDDFKKMDTTERVKFSREHPEEFKQITGGH